MSWSSVVRVGTVNEMYLLDTVSASRQAQDRFVLTLSPPLIAQAIRVVCDGGASSETAHLYLWGSVYVSEK